MAILRWSFRFKAKLINSCKTTLIKIEISAKTRVLCKIVFILLDVDFRRRQVCFDDVEFLSESKLLESNSALALTVVFVVFTELLVF